MDKSPKPKKKSYIASWTKFFLDNYRITILLMVMFLLSGFYSLVTINKDDIPQIDIPYYMMTSVYPGASAEEVEEKIVNPIEDKLKDIDGIDEYEGAAANSYANVFATISADADSDKVTQEIKDKVSEVKLPDDAEAINFEKIDIAGQPFMYLTVTTDKPYDDLFESSKKFLEDLEKIDGVATAKNLDNPEKRIVVDFDKDKLSDNFLTSEQVKEKLIGENISLPGGEVKQDATNLPIEVNGRLKNLDDIKNLEVINQFNQPVKLSDVATVNYAFDRAESVNTYVKAEDSNDFLEGNSILVGVTKESNTDIVDTSIRVEEFLGNIEDDDYGCPVESHIVYNTADEVNKQISGLRESALMGALVIFIVLMFFVNWRGALIIVLCIPIVLLITFTVFQFIGYTFNIMTLFALFITLGMLVDNAIVIVEGIQYKLDLGFSKRQAAIRAIRDMGPAVLSATLTTVLVYIPLATMSGVTGEFIKFIPYVIITSIIASYFVAVTIVPLLGMWINRASKKAGDSIKEEVTYNKIIEGFGKHIKQNLKSRWRKAVIVIATLAIMIATFSLPISGALKMEMWPTQEDSRFSNLKIEFPKGTTTAEKNDTLNTIKEDLKDIDELRALFPLTIGMGPDMAFSGLTMVYTPESDRDKSATDLVEEINNIIEDKKYTLGDEELTVYAELYAEGPPTDEYDLRAQITGDDLEKVKQAAIDAAADLESEEGIVKIDDGVSDNTVKKVTVDLDPEKIKDKGLSNFMVAGTVRTIFTEEEVSKLTDPTTKKTTPIYFKYTDDVKDNLDDVKTTQIFNGRELVNLEDVADINEVEELTSINHFNGDRYVVFSVDLDEDTLPLDIQNKINDYFTEEKLAEYGLEEDAILFRGQFDDEAQDFNKLMQVFIIAIVLIFTILVFQFKSFFQPLLIVAAVPLSLILVFPGLMFMDIPLSFFALVGIIALSGIVVNDSIVLIDTINRYRRQGLDKTEAVTRGVKQRFKPILATSITTIAGVLPLSFANAFLAPIGFSLSFGLLSATIFTLYVIPVVYQIFVREKKK